MIWFTLVIPAIIGQVAYKLYSPSVRWWEAVLPTVVGAIVIPIIIGVSQYAQTKDLEYWGSITKQVEYYEEWSEWIHRTCECCCDDKGNNCSTYDCSYEDVHPPEWRLRTTSDEELRISAKQFEAIAKKFRQRPIEVELHRNSCCHNDGDMWKVVWSGTRETAEPVTTTHSYTNRIQASASDFRYPEVTIDDVKKYQLYTYPMPMGYHESGVLDRHKVTPDNFRLQLDLLNGLYGPSKQLRLWVLTFNDQPRQAAIEQQNYWQGGNKNELVICIGLQAKTKVAWGHVFSWSEKEKPKLLLRNYIEASDSLNWQELAEQIEQIIPLYQRKSFSDFNYLAIELPLGTVLLTVLILIVLSVGMLFGFIKAKSKYCY